MICPNCGKELAEGHLLCESCGHEINLVPEFEAAVEESIAESMKNIVDETSSVVVEEKKKKGIRKKDIGFIVFGIVMAAVVFLVSAVISGGKVVWKDSTYIHEKAVEYYLEEGEYEAAVSYLEKMIKLAPKKVSYRFWLCKLYMDNGQEEAALEGYKIIAGGSQFEFEEQMAAVEKIVSYYEAKQEYQSIADYLATIQDENIRLTYWKYMCLPVIFSQAEGTYASLITLKLDSDGFGTIYYTTDGTEPTTESMQFKGTIFLETGDNVISAMFVNDYGVASPITTKRYFIEAKQVSAPEVLTYSGTYKCPIQIEVEVNPYTRVYYTTDGTMPNARSNRYTSAIPVPLGKSVYKFVAIDSNGVASEVISREFTISLDTTMTIEDAKKILITDFENKGNVLDGRGNVLLDETHVLVYEYLYPKTIEVGKDCYYFAEVSRDVTTMEQHRTGNYYGVDVRTEEIYQFTD